MKKYKTYSEKLKDPKWQKKRLKVLERDEFTCQTCWNKEDMLVAHHKYYEKGKDPWEYPMKALITLCDPCHKKLKPDHLKSDDEKPYGIIKDVLRILKKYAIKIKDNGSVTVNAISENIFNSASYADGEKINPTWSFDSFARTVEDDYGDPDDSERARENFFAKYRNL